MISPREQMMWQQIDKALAEGIFNRAVEIYRTAHYGVTIEQAKKIIGTRANNGYYTRIVKARKQMLDSIKLHCLAFDTFDATEADIHKCFNQAADRCWEYIQRIRELAKKNGGS